MTGVTQTQRPAQQLTAWAELWWQAVGDFTELVEALDDELWSTPTDLPGWDVKAVASHVAHIEGLTAGAPAEHAVVGEAAHVRNLMGHFTEIGVLNRREASPGEIVAEIRRHTASRRAALLANPPTDPSLPAPVAFAPLGWDTGTLLRNRPLDLWMHEQDVRRAVGRPGGLHSPAADHSTAYLLEGLGYVLAKRVGAPVGTSLVAYIDGSPPAAYVVGPDGRGRAAAQMPAGPTITLRMSRETFIRLAGGRGRVDREAVTITGDRALGEQILDCLAVTP